MTDEEIALELTKLQLANPSISVSELYVSYRNQLNANNLKKKKPMLKVVSEENPEVNR